MKSEFFKRIGGFITQFFKIIKFIKKNKLQQSPLKKLKIFLWYLEFTFKDIFLARFLKKTISSEKFLNYRIGFSHYASFRSLFIEIFILEQYYFKTAKKHPYIIDCGANIGMSVLFFKFLYPDSIIVAFEPNKDSFAFLKNNIAINKFEHIMIYNVALSDKKGEVEFYVNNLNDSVGTAIKGIFQKEELLVRKVKSEILSIFIDQEVDLLKIDVEGCEDIILLELVDKRKLGLIKNMIIEYHPYLCQKIKNIDDFVAFLHDNQFNCVVESHGKNYLIYARKV